MNAVESKTRKLIQTNALIFDIKFTPPEEQQIESYKQILNSEHVIKTEKHLKLLNRLSGIFIILGLLNVFYFGFNHISLNIVSIFSICTGLLFLKAGGLGWVEFVNYVSIEKEKLDNIQSDQCLEFLELCKKDFDIEAYRQKVLLQSRAFKIAELEMARDYIKTKYQLDKVAERESYFKNKCNELYNLN